MFKQWLTKPLLSTTKKSNGKIRASVMGSYIKQQGHDVIVSNDSNNNGRMMNYSKIMSRGQFDSSAGYSSIGGNNNRRTSGNHVLLNSSSSSNISNGFKEVNGNFSMSFNPKATKKVKERKDTEEITDLLDFKDPSHYSLETVERGLINLEFLDQVIATMSQNSERIASAKTLGIEDEDDWESTISSFRYNFLHTFETNNDMRTKIKKAFKMAQKDNKSEDLMWSLYLKDLEDQIEEERILKIADLTEPHQLYPLTRLKKRKIIFHIGPTNSGKTYNAFQALRNAKTGIYCAPLRLLATEAYVKLTSGDNPLTTCQLITGDFKIEAENATHTCSTTEMADINTEIDVAVIDEIQLITDPDRGWSWTKAILGVRANEVHLCGEGRVLKLIEKLCHDTGDELEVKEYNRLTTLNVTKQPTLKSFNDLEKGDCIVCFSRKEVFRMKNEIEKSTNLRVCVVYGGLPPQTRIIQAALFNHERSPYDVLVATDAIGMGLNLNIRRVIFSATEKFDGKEVRTLTPHEIKQIGGRAGRFNSAFEEGEVTSFRNGDCKVIHHAFSYDPSLEEESLRAGLFPTDEQIDHFSRQFENENHRVRLSTILSKFYEITQVNKGKYFMCEIEEKKDIANIIHPIENLTTAERMIFVKSPIDPDESLCKDMAFKWAKLYSEGKDVPLSLPNPNTMKPINTLMKLKDLEVMYKCLNVYSWLSYRLEPFKERERSFEYQEICRQLIEEALKQTVSLERKEKSEHRESRGGGGNGYSRGHKHKTSVKHISKKHKKQMQDVLSHYNLNR